LANLLAIGGNWNTAGSWGLVHSGSMQNTGATSTVWPTSMSYGPNFAGDNLEIDGVAMYFEYRSASPNGWGKVVLRNTSDNLDAAGPITFDIADLPAEPTSGDGGFWVFFKFASPVTLTTGKNFAIGVQAQNGTQIYGYKTATANDFNRLLRRTATAAPQAGDTLWINGEITGQGTGNDVTITYDNNVADAYAGLWVGNRGILDASIAATTQLIMAGNFYVTAGGKYQQGTVANPMGAAYTHTIQFNAAADNGYFFSLRSGGTLIGQGNPLTYDRALLNAEIGGSVNVAAGTNPMVTRLYGPLLTTANGYTVGATILLNGTGYVIRTATADAGATLQITGSPGALTSASCILNNITAITADVSTAWKTGDDIAIAPTNQTYTQGERKTLGADASGTTITLPSALIYMHEGAAPAKAEIINLTRNVIWKCSNSAYGFYWSISSKATVDLDWVVLSGFGSSSVIKTTTGSFNAQRCAIKDCRATPFILTHANLDNVTIKDNVGYNVASYGSYGITVTLATTGTTGVIIDGNWFIYIAGGTHGIYSVDAGITIINNVMCGCKGNGFYISEAGATIGTFNNNKAHSNYENGFTFNTATGSIGDGQVCFRNRGYTAPTAGFELLTCFNLNIGTLETFGNNTANLYITGAEITFTGFTGHGDQMHATSYGLNLASVVAKLKFVNSDFGTPSGIKVAHATADLAAPVNTPIYIDLENTKLGSGAGKEVVGIYTPESFVRSSDHGQVSGAFKSWFMRGTIEKDNTYYNTAAPSQRLTPNTHADKLKSGMKRFSILSGTTATVKANLRKSSVATGGADYDGAQPRLMCKANPMMGINSDQVLDTMTAGLNSWEELSGVTPAITANGVLEVYVDVDGDVGFVNVDDWGVS
jgi:hypothetical protein